jgi:hypothetical protein
MFCTEQVYASPIFLMVANAPSPNFFDSTPVFGGVPVYKRTLMGCKVTIVITSLYSVLAVIISCYWLLCQSPLITQLKYFGFCLIVRRRLGLFWSIISGWYFG